MSAKSLKAVVVGGSISGLMSAIVLRSANYEVTVLERTPKADFKDRGSGLALRPEVVDFLQAYSASGLLRDTYDPVTAFGMIKRDGVGMKTIQMPAGTHTTSWATIVATLRSTFESINKAEGSYKSGSRVTNVKQQHDSKMSIEYIKDDKVETIEGIDMIVGADGANSTVRKLVIGSVPREYSGYILYRGIVPIEDLTSATLAIFDNHIVIHTCEAHNTVSYRIPYGTSHGIMWASYVNTPESLLPDLMTSSSGHTYTNTLPAGEMSTGTQAILNDLAKISMAPQLQEVVEKTINPMIQTITDLASPSNAAFGYRVLLVSEASTLLRPHTYSGASQSAFHALRLKDLVEGRIDAEQWSADTLTYSRTMLEAGREVGGLLLNSNEDGSEEAWRKTMGVLQKAHRRCKSIREEGA